MASIADTSFIVALGNKNEKDHEACNQVKRREQIIYVPQSVLAEVGYMLKRDLGSRGLAHFLRTLPETKYRIVSLELRDVLRTADLLDKYADARPDFVDLSIVAVAERMTITRILTLDRRDFDIIRPAHTDHFELLP
jgi:predicted nucleic acid-binding protein